MNKKTKTYIFFFGPIGSGKGTQSDRLGEKLKLPVISTGELFRRELKLDTKFGRQIKKFVTSGKLVTDALTLAILNKRLAKPDAKPGFILDGFPRNRTQLDHILNKIDGIGQAPKKIIAVYIYVSDQVVKSRIGGRRVCVCGATYHIKFNPPKNDSLCDVCGKKIFQRDDDKPAAIKTRLGIFHKAVLPLIDLMDKNYRLIKVNGDAKIERIAEEIYRQVSKAIK